MEKKKDMQRRKVERAERLFFGINPLPQAENVNALRLMVNKIISREPMKHDVYIRSYYGGRQRNVTAKKTVRRYDPGTYSGWFTIKMPLGRKTMLDLVHAAAHCIAEDNPEHGRKWAKTYLALVRKYLGDDAWMLLRGCFRGCRVRWIERKKKGDAEDVKCDGTD